MTDISPSPWKDSGNLGFGRWITADDGAPVAVSYGPRVNDSSDANTRLIVGAPELLWALKELTCQIEISNAVDDNGHALINLMALVRARAAIAKAEGEAR